MNRYEKYNLTPEQQKIVDEKVADLARAVKNIDFNNLPKRENNPNAANPTNGSKPAEKA